MKKDSNETSTLLKNIASHLHDTYSDSLKDIIKNYEEERDIDFLVDEVIINYSAEKYFKHRRMIDTIYDDLPSCQKDVYLNIAAGVIDIFNKEYI